MAEQATVTIPSMGLLNDIPGGHVVLRTMKVKEEKLLLTKMSPGAKIISVLGKCIVEPKGCSVRELPVVDLLYLFFELRKLSISHTYDLRCVCTMCRRNFVEQIKLPDDLKIRYANQNGEEEGEEAASGEVQEPWTINLNNGDLLEIRYLRGTDMLDLEQLVRSRQVSGIDPGDDGYVERMARHIVTVSGEKKSVTATLAYLENLSSKDSNLIKDAMEGKDFGAGLTVGTECPGCGFIDEEIIRLSPEFFRPKTNK
jgi:hypothetical protein